MPFKEALGTVLNSYQNKMEEEWVKELRSTNLCLGMN